jgi:hypothetical protein
VQTEPSLRKFGGRIGNTGHCEENLGLKLCHEIVYTNVHIQGRETVLCVEALRAGLIFHNSEFADRRLALPVRALGGLLRRPAIAARNRRAATGPKKTPTEF